MKKFIIYTLLLLLPIIVEASDYTETFKNSFMPNAVVQEQAINEIIEYDDGYLLSSYEYYCTGNCYTQSLLIKVDKEGKEEWRQEFSYQNPGSNQPGIVESYNNTILYINGMTGIKEYSPDGELLNEYTDLKGTQILKKDNLYYIVKVQIGYSRPNMVIIKTDKDFNVLGQSDTIDSTMGEAVIAEDKIVTTNRVYNSVTKVYDVNLVEIDKDLNIENNTITLANSSTYMYLDTGEKELYYYDGYYYYVYGCTDDSIAVKINSTTYEASSLINMFTDEYHYDFPVVRVSKDKIIFGGLKQSYDSAGNYTNVDAIIQIYNFNGELEKELIVNEDFDLSNDDKVNVVKTLLFKDNGAIVAGGILINAESTAFVIEYEPIYEIEVLVDGNGTLTSKEKQAREGTIIEFEVKPDDGYELSYIEVTDANNNTVVFKDYTFTMPNSDIIIEATFTPIPKEENPETKDYAMLAFSVLLLSAEVTAILILNKENKKSSI